VPAVAGIAGKHTNQKHQRPGQELREKHASIDFGGCRVSFRPWNSEENYPECFGETVNGQSPIRASEMIAINMYIDWYTVPVDNP